MKICLVNSFYYPDIIGGAEISVLKLAEQLKKNGHDVYVLCTSNIESVEYINGVEVHRVRIKNVYNPIDKVNKKKNISSLKKSVYSIINTYNLFNYRLLKDKLEEISPEVLHINNIDGISIVIWKVAQRMGIKMVQTLRDYSLLKNNNNLLDKIRNPLYMSQSNLVECVTAPSKYTIDSFLSEKYFSKSYSQVIYNAIDYSEDMVIKSLKNKLDRAKSNMKVRFVFLGRLDNGKGIKFLLDTFMKIDNPNIELIIAGKGECEIDIKNATKIDSRVIYKGFLDEKNIDKVLIDSDVLIIPSLWPEPFGRVIIEAYKFAMPVIGSDIGGIPEVINKKTGILIKPMDEKDLKVAIEYFCDRDNIKKYITNCAEEINKYNIKLQTEEFVKLYRKLINKK